MTKFLNISVDNTLGGNSPSDVAVSSQKAVKEYVDAHSGGSVSVDDVTINRDSNQKLQAIGLINKNEVSGAVSPLGVWNGTETQWNQGEATTWYNWMYGGTSITSGTALPTTNGFSRVLNDGTNVYFFSNNAGTYYYSPDGTSWSSGTTPMTENTSVCYGNGIYLSFYMTDTSYAYSTDGISWSTKTAPLYSVYDCVYGDKFVCVLPSNAMYSTDGENWTSVSLPISGYHVTYGNNLYVAMSSSGPVAYSSDGATWTTATTSPTTVTGGYMSLAYGNGKFVTLGYNGNTVAYSDDGDVWTTTTNLPRSQYWVSVTYGDGYFLAAGRDSQYAAYSTDGINWTEITLPASGRYYGVTYMGDTFYGASSNSTSTFKVSFASLECFTADQNPTTASTVYDAVSVPSTLTITSVGTGTITLSDGKTYTYNPSGNDFSYRTIGEVHPDWLCNINGVGVKIGDEFIANNSNGFILEALYPVGSIYITTANTCPLSILIAGSTWELVSSGRVLQGSDSNHTAGTTIEAGLPNITGTVSHAGYGTYNPKGQQGALSRSSSTFRLSSSDHSSGTLDVYGISIDASQSSSIYGNSTTVQPPAYVVNIWERTA